MPRRLLVATILSFASLATAQDHSNYSPADIAAGARLYREHCMTCHGPDGELVAGVNLRTGQFRKVVTDQELSRLIANGLPGTAMPPHKFNPPELTATVAYLRNMRAFEERPVALGDAARGRAIFETTGGCIGCHRVNGKGSRVAPDLSDIGLLRTAGAIHQSLVDPTAAMLPINRPVRAVTRDGKVINGRRLNEDTYTVQLLDDQERLVSLVKADLREYTIFTKSPKESLQGKLTPEQLADVLAYLVTLKGSTS